MTAVAPAVSGRGYHARAAALRDRDWRMLIAGRLVGAAGGETYETLSPGRPSGSSAPRALHRRLTPAGIVGTAVLLIDGGPSFH